MGEITLAGRLSIVGTGAGFVGELLGGGLAIACGGRVSFFNTVKLSSGRRGVRTWLDRSSDFVGSVSHGLADLVAGGLLGLGSHGLLDLWVSVSLGSRMLLRADAWMLTVRKTLAAGVRHVGCSGDE